MSAVRQPHDELIKSLRSVHPAATLTELRLSSSTRSFPNVVFNKNIHKYVFVKSESLDLKSDQRPRSDASFPSSLMVNLLPLLPGCLLFHLPDFLLNCSSRA